MRKYQWIVIIALIGCIVSFMSCERGQKMMEPILPDAEPEVVKPEPPEMVETPVEPVEEMMEPEPPEMVETPADPPTDPVVEPPVEVMVEPETPAVPMEIVPTGLPLVFIDPEVIVSPSVGKQFTVNINITGGENITGYQATISFDSTALSYVSSANADYLFFGAFPAPAKVSGNEVTVAAAHPFGAASKGAGTLATVTFEVVEAKASTIGLASVILADPDANALENTTANGMVTAP